MNTIVVRGSGDLATGTIWMLAKAGYPVVALEAETPLAIRREAAFSEAVRLGSKEVEGITAHLAASGEEALRIAAPGRPAVLVDPEAELLACFRPEILIDAILAKKNLGTNRSMADFTIGIGPGFTAGEDVDAVIETMRGHDLGRVILKGSALPNTGVPGLVAGHGADRVIHSPAAGRLTGCRRIGDEVTIGEPIARITSSDGSVTEVAASLTGVLRGLLPDGCEVWEGLKMADIDPRAGERKNCFTVSDKARCIGGSVLMLVSAWEKGVFPDASLRG